MGTCPKQYTSLEVEPQGTLEETCREPIGITTITTPINTLTTPLQDTLTGDPMEYHKVDLQALDLRQEELEDMSRFWGHRRFSSKVEKDGTKIGAGKTLLQEAVSRTVFYLEEWLQDREGKRGPKPVMYGWLKKVGVETAAFVSCQVALRALNGDLLVPSAARSISHRIQYELRARRFRELAPRLFNRVIGSFNTTSYSHMARSINAQAQRAQCTECWEQGIQECPHMQFEDLKMGDGEREMVGIQLLNAVTEAMEGWFERENVRTSQDGRYGPPVEMVYLRLTPMALEWIEDRNETLKDLVPVFLPMVLPPLPWDQGAPGGYRHSLRGVCHLVRGSSHQRRLVDEQASPTFYDAINRLQEVPYRVNLRILEVLEALEERGGDIAGIPRTEPFEMSWHLGDNPSPDEVKAYRRESGALKDLEHDRLSAVSDYARFKAVVHQFKDEDAFFFPWSVDFRGRAYPIPPHLNPQGSDRARGLLEFADGVALGATGAFWLAVHLANSLDEHQGLKFSKLTLQERYEWVQRHSDQICEVAGDPLAHTWWLEAEDPFQTLAAIFEWAGYVEQGEDYVSHLPVHIDGSANGIQHFSAILRDPTGAKAVNVLPNERPEDLYLRVADSVLDRLKRDASMGNNIAQGWLGTGLVTRKLAKRPTMTFAYGSKRFGFTDQLHSYLKGLPEWADLRSEWFERDQVGEALRYMAECLWDALKDVVTGAFDALEWLQEQARIIAQENRPVRWTVPVTGFPVVQDGFQYWLSEQKRLETVLCGGVRYQPVYMSKSKKVSSKKQANGVSPNLVHSLDAAVMMITVRMAAEEGVEHLAMIHDSFGTHAGNMEILRDVTRRSFYEFYRERDALEEFYHQALDQVSVESMQSMEPPPDMGTLDLAQVLRSEYFFA